MSFRSTLSIAADTARLLLAAARWLVESTVLLLVGWVRFLFGTWRGFIVGLLVVALLVAADEIPGPQGAPAIDSLPATVLNAITVLELFVIAASVRLASGVRKPRKRAGWGRFIGSWVTGGTVYVLAVALASQLSANGGYSTATVQMIVIVGTALAVLLAGAVNNGAALRRVLSAEHTRSTARLTRKRILTALATRPLPAPAGAAYCSWYAWSACALSASPAAAHRAAEAAISARRAGVDSRKAADAALRSRWAPAGLIERISSSAGSTA